MGQAIFVCNLCRNWKDSSKARQNTREKRKLSMARDTFGIRVDFTRRFISRARRICLQVRCFNGMIEILVFCFENLFHIDSNIMS